MIPNEPLAYLLTFTCYGTWLHGDRRGSVDKDHNLFGEEILPKDVEKEKEDFTRLKHAPTFLTLGQRQTVTEAIHEVCRHRCWILHEVNARSNHVHIVVSAKAEPKKMIGDFKSYATRKLREMNRVESETKIWTRGGSRRYLWNEDAVKAACRYVREQ